MKKILFMSATLLIAGAAGADQRIDRSLDAAAKSHVTVSNLSGSIEIDGWDENRVTVSGTIGDDVDELVFERDGDEITIKVKIPDRRWGNRDVSANLDIRVPAASSIEVSGVSSDIDVEGVRGSQDLQSVSGDITASLFAADIDAETVSGDVDVRGSGEDSDADLSTVSGDIDATRLAGRVRAVAVSGDVEISGASFERVKVETVNGEVVFKGELREDGRLDGESVNGDVEIILAGDISARFEIETFNGRIRNCFGPEPARVSEHGPGWELVFTEGDGSGRVSLATLNGGVELCTD
jgi:DUF4097 and DUF4098 domain-containing protein YvlB